MVVFNECVTRVSLCTYDDTEFRPSYYPFADQNWLGSMFMPAGRWGLTASNEAG